MITMILMQSQWKIVFFLLINGIFDCYSDVKMVTKIDIKVSILHVILGKHFCSGEAV